jgi:hypothetical protein
LQGWLNALKSKDARGWIIRAASQAQAANYILNIQPEAQPSESSVPANGLPSGQAVLPGLTVFRQGRRGISASQPADASNFERFH